MKSFDFIWWFIGGALVGFLLFGDGLSKLSKKSESDLLREQQLAKEKNIEKQFNSDFAFVCERIADRDIEIYSLAEKRDREILQDVEQIALPTNSNDIYRLKLETRLIQRLKRHIEECIRFRSRIRECRSSASARWLYADIFQTKCDCDCCNRD